MSELKRSWTPCSICKKYYEYSCNDSIKNCKNFIPENCFVNFLANNMYEIRTLRDWPLDTIYLIEKDFVINNIKDYLDLRNKSPKFITETLHYKMDFIHTFFLSIDDNIRDLIYKDFYIMSHYNINMIVNNDIKKSLKYRLDERFNYITFEKFQKDTIL